MIAIKDVTKSFDKLTVVDHVSLHIGEGSVFGLIGTNGAGKSTLFRMLTGIYRPDSGEILVDGTPVWDMPDAKKLFYFIPDEPFFFANATPADMEEYTSSVYENFNREEYYDFLQKFGLDKHRKIRTFSKGMKKQVAFLLGICSNCKYLICDETFDGLDPVMRQGIKSILASKMDQGITTPIISSHNLRELEDICDCVGLLHKGGVLFSKDLEDLKSNITKVQCVFAHSESKAALQEKLQVLTESSRGALWTATVRGSREDVLAAFEAEETIFFEALPLSLEEIFIEETEVEGYDIKELLAE